MGQAESEWGGPPSAWGRGLWVGPDPSPGLFGGGRRKEGVNERASWSPLSVTEA